PAPRRYARVAQPESQAARMVPSPRAFDTGRIERGDFWRPPSRSIYGDRLHGGGRSARADPRRRSRGQHRAPADRQRQDESAILEPDQRVRAIDRNPRAAQYIIQYPGADRL